MLGRSLPRVCTAQGLVAPQSDTPSRSKGTHEPSRTPAHWVHLTVGHNGEACIYYFYLDLYENQKESYSSFLHKSGTWVRKCSRSWTPHTGISHLQPKVPTHLAQNKLFNVVTRKTTQETGTEELPSGEFPARLCVAASWATETHQMLVAVPQCGARGWDTRSRCGGCYGARRCNRSHRVNFKDLHLIKRK